MHHLMMSHHLLDNIVVNRTSEALYFLFDAELAKTERSVHLLLHSIAAAAKALDTANYIDFPIDQITSTATQTRCKKLLLKYSRGQDQERVELYERE